MKEKDKKLLSAYAMYPTGVAVITASHNNKNLAMTISSFCGISVKPPIITWSINNNNPMYLGYCQSKFQAINILNSKQALVAKEYASKENSETKNKALAKLKTEQSWLSLDNFYCQLKCSLNQTLVLGDHTLIALDVLDITSNFSDPLVYYDRSFHSIK